MRHFTSGNTSFTLQEDAQRRLTTHIQGAPRPLMVTPETFVLRGYARDGGWGSNTWRCMVCHDVTHVVVSQFFGLPSSPTLAYECDLQVSWAERGHGVRVWEEDLVTALQRLHRGRDHWLGQIKASDTFWDRYNSWQNVYKVRGYPPLREISSFEEPLAELRKFFELHNLDPRERIYVCGSW
jgi:hypothetical protein